MRYAVVIEKAESNYSAYVPDLPGCIAVLAEHPHPNPLPRAGEGWGEGNR